jgi:hypothetical protein
MSLRRGRVYNTTRVPGFSGSNCDFDQSESIDWNAQCGRIIAKSQVFAVFPSNRSGQLQCGYLADPAKRQQTIYDLTLVWMRLSQANNSNKDDFVNDVNHICEQSHSLGCVRRGASIHERI